MSPPPAAACGGASRATGYRLWRRFREGGWAALRDRARCRGASRGGSARGRAGDLGARRRSAYGPVRLAGRCRTRPRRSARCCVGTAARGFRGRGAARCVRATSASGRASCCTSTSRSSAASGRWASASSARGGQRTNRRAGWQYLHVAIDDHSRLAYAELLPGQNAEDCAASSSAPSPGTASRAIVDRARAHRQRQGLPLPRLARACAPARASSAATHVPTDRGPTARQKR